ncbi:MAG: hypothetical protein HOP27_09125 [Anaerolineales bacterium]|nr:hypothetical protein [Anaerolineales bacterium]
MITTFLQTKIPVNQLLVDTQNPRLPEMQTNQDDAIRLMIKAQGSKVFALAQHLATYGTNPASLLIVIPNPENQKKYYVLDGNRRLTALRLLERPGLSEGILNGSIFQKIKDLSLKYKNNPVNELECVVFNDREQADLWVQLIHRGENQGVGLVKWDGQVAARYDERKGLGERGAAASLQILDLIKEDKNLSQKTHEKIESGKFPITSLTRLINTPYVRKKIGLNIKNNMVDAFEDKTIKSLAKIVDDLGTEYKTVSDIKRVGQRIDYIDNLFEPRPIEAENLREETLVNSLSTVGVKKKAPKEEKLRTTLIPREFLADVTQSRINKIFVELKKLDVNEFPNAASVMFRVFLELSLDHYLEETIKWSDAQIDNSGLAQKLIAVATDFEKKQKMNSQQLAPIRKAAGGQTLLVASIKTLHSYVHNKYFSPIPSELKTAWDDMATFVSNLWPV